METKEIITRDGRPVYKNMQDMTGLRFDPKSDVWIVPPDMYARARQLAQDGFAYMWIPANSAGDCKRTLISWHNLNEESDGTITLRIAVCDTGD